MADHWKTTTVSSLVSLLCVASLACAQQAAYPGPQALPVVQPQVIVVGSTQPQSLHQPQQYPVPQQSYHPQPFQPQQPQVMEGIYGEIPSNDFQTAQHGTKYPHPRYQCRPWLKAYGMGGWAHHDEINTSSFWSELRFQFGSSRAFFGENCLPGPPPVPVPPGYSLTPGYWR